METLNKHQLKKMTGGQIGAEDPEFDAVVGALNAASSIGGAVGALAGFIVARST